MDETERAEYEARIEFLEGTIEKLNEQLEEALELLGEIKKMVS